MELFRARGKPGDQAFPKLCLDRRQDIEYASLFTYRRWRGYGQPDDRAGRWLLRDYRSWRYRDPHAGAMDVVIIGMNGKVAYRGEVTDGQRIMVSSGIYA